MESLSKHKHAFLSVGSGGSGQLLQGTLDDYTKLQPIFSTKISLPNNPEIETFKESITTIALGGTKGLGLTTNNEVYSWGEEFEGPEQKVQIEPILVLRSPLKVTKISSGWAHNICLTENNEVYLWGEGKFGQLGLGKDKRINVPKPTILPLEEEGGIKVVDVVAGFRQSYLLTEKNQIVCFGSNKTLELGQSTPDPIVSSPLTVCFFENGQKIIKLSCGQRHAVVLDASGELYGWGCNKFGQLGSQEKKEKAYTPVKLSIPAKVKDISCGWSHVMALTEDSDVYLTGRGNFGQQGTGKHEDCFGFHKIQFSEELKVKKVVSGSEACHVISEDDEIYVWGWNEHGNLALGDKTDRSTPVQLNIDCKGKNPEIYCGGAALILQLQ